MQITDISFKIPENDTNPKLVALADITLDNQLVIKSIKIIAGSKGLFVAMPVKKSKQGFFRDILVITDGEFHKLFEEKILAAYGQNKSKLNKKPA